MTAFQSKWDDWAPQTRKKHTDNADNGPENIFKYRIVSAVSAGKGNIPAEAAIDPVCLICSEPADNSNSNVVHDGPGDPDYRRVHFTPECYDAWFKAAFGISPAPTRLYLLHPIR